MFWPLADTTLHHWSSKGCSNSSALAFCSVFLGNKEKSRATQPWFGEVACVVSGSVLSDCSFLPHDIKFPSSLLKIRLSMDDCIVIYSNSGIICDNKKWIHENNVSKWLYLKKYGVKKTKLHMYNMIPFMPHLKICKMILCIVQVNIHVYKSIKICFGMITSKFRIRV